MSKINFAQLHNDELSKLKRYTIKDIAENVRLPVCVRVVKGFDGVCEEDTLASGEVFTLMCDRTDTYVVAQNVRRKTVSIPVNSTAPFTELGVNPLDKNLKVWQALVDRDPVERRPHPISYWESRPKPVVVSFYTKKDAPRNVYDALTLESVEQDKVLVAAIGHVTDPAQIQFGQIITIPLKMDVEVVLVDEMYEQSQYIGVTQKVKQMTLFYRMGSNNDYKSQCSLHKDLSMRRWKKPLGQFAAKRAPTLKPRQPARMSLKSSGNANPVPQRSRAMTTGGKRQKQTRLSRTNSSPEKVAPPRPTKPKPRHMSVSSLSKPDLLKKKEDEEVEGYYQFLEEDFDDYFQDVEESPYHFPIESFDETEEAAEYEMPVVVGGSLQEKAEYLMPTLGGNPDYRLLHPNNSNDSNNGQDNTLAEDGFGFPDADSDDPGGIYQMPSPVDDESNNRKSKPLAATKSLKYTVEDVQVFLEKLGLDQYKESFKKERIDGAILTLLDDEILEQDLGVKSKLHRLRIKDAASRELS